MIKCLLLRGLAVIACLAMVSCSSIYTKNSDTDTDPSLLDTGLKKQASPPWQLWVSKKDLDGVKIKHTTILAGDEAAETGKYNEALKLYSIAEKQSLDVSEKKANALRISSVLLSLNRPESALKVLGKYLNKNNLTPEQVDFNVSILLAYAYGLARNYDQSFAWFSQTSNLADSSSSLTRTTDHGISYVLKRIPASDFETAVKPWALDPKFSNLIEEESERRGLKFAHGDDSVAANTTSGNLSLNSSKFLLLAPLSGQHASFGNSVSRGMQLALIEANLPADTFDKIDTGSDPARLNQQITEDVIKSHSLVIGPLLGEHVMTVSAKAVGLTTPIIHLSKNDTLKNGNMIIPFGISIQSQCDQLVAKAVRNMGLYKFAIVHPEDKNGIEYSREFAKAAAKYGAGIVLDEGYQKNDKSRFSVIAEKLEKLNYDAVFIPDRARNASDILSLATNQQTAKTTAPAAEKIALGAAYWNQPSELKQSAAILDGAVFIAPFFPESPRAEVVNFVKKYKEKFGVTPDLLAAQSYDLVKVAIRALQYARDHNSTMAEGLNNIDTYQGVTGSIQPDSEVGLKRDYDVLKFKNGQFEAVN